MLFLQLLQLYKKNSEKTLSKELFKNPTSEYRGTPFWAWNDYLTKEELERQIEVFNEMGLGGFHMHVRTGLKNKYLSEEFMGLVKNCVDKAKQEKMLANAAERVYTVIISEFYNGKIFRAGCNSRPAVMVF